jgi:hypothetical protein
MMSRLRSKQQGWFCKKKGAWLRISLSGPLFLWTTASASSLKIKPHFAIAFALLLEDRHSSVRWRPARHRDSLEPSKTAISEGTARHQETLSIFGLALFSGGE